jgi:predicted 3-demethylubiquinone-9 3-methyltransferase (glyoxalase superfamily)
MQRNDTMNPAQTITPCLWFDANAEQAIEHYLAIFKNSRLLSVTRAGPNDAVLAASFLLAGQEFTALNGGPMFKFNEAISLVVRCESQDELDTYWAQLGDGGSYQPCGWLKDKFGVSWQIVPAALFGMLQDPDRAKAGRVMEALMKMSKLDIAALAQAHRGQ